MEQTTTNTVPVTEETKDTTPQTEVTSVAIEEQKTGQKINVPPEQELLSRAGSSFLLNRKRLAEIFPKLSSKEKNRAIQAILDLPMDGLPVYLKSEAEKLCFAIGQRIIADRFILTQYYINEERKRMAEEFKNKPAEVPQDQPVSDKGESKDGE